MAFDDEKSGCLGVFFRMLGIGSKRKPLVPPRNRCSAPLDKAKSGMVYEFLIPNIDPGLPDEMTEALPGQGDVRGQSKYRDTIRFEIQGRTWLLRKLVNDSVTADLAFRQAQVAGRIPGVLIPTLDCCLQVESDDFSKDDASEIADDICWLLQLPLGQKVAWTEIRYRQGDERRTVELRSVLVASQPQSNQPIRNHADGRLRQYLQNAYPIYKEDPKWWRITLDWMAIAFETPVIQVAGLICSMLLERIPRFLLRKEKFPPQIDPDLAERIGKNKPNRAETAALISGVFKPLANGWKDEQSGALLDIVLNWNAEPSYSAKIKTAFGSLGMTPPSGEVMDNRHSLAHNGELKSGTSDVSGYFGQVLRTTTAVLLRALGYTGKFFSLGVGEVQV